MTTAKRARVLSPQEKANRKASPWYAQKQSDRNRPIRGFTISPEAHEACSELARAAGLDEYGNPVSRSAIVDQLILDAFAKLGRTRKLTE